MHKTAVISACGKYRYELTRVWDTDLPMVCFIGLNPSTADSDKDDPTIRKCIAFSKQWGYGGFIMLNVFAFRTVSPVALKSAQRRGEDVEISLPCILENRIKKFNAALSVIACWGKHAGDYGIRLARGLEHKETCGFTLQCLGHNKDGSPKHPLYLKASTERERFNKK